MKKATKAEQNLYNLIKKKDTNLYKTLKEIYKTEGIGIPLATCKKVNLVNHEYIGQLTGRIYRINQIGEVKMITLISDSGLLKNLQTGYVEEIEREGIKAKRSWSPGGREIYQKLNIK